MDYEDIFTKIYMNRNEENITMTLKLSKDVQKFLQDLGETPQNNQYGEFVFRRRDLNDRLAKCGLSWASVKTIMTDKDIVQKAANGWYDLTDLIQTANDQISEANQEKARKEDERLRKKLKAKGEAPEELEKKTTEFVPEIDDTYVPWGHTREILAIVSTPRWFPAYIVGETGNGKTAMVEQCCARAGREMFRAQIHEDTDEDDLIGGFRLKDGDTVFEYGPVIRAMQSGGVLFLDEIDRGSNKLMCLQGVLEGKPYLIKKIGEIIKPATGFNVIAAANTRGKGDETGRYISSTILDEAFLERFYITFNQKYPTMAVERRIIRNNMIKHDCLDEKFCEHLVRWSDNIRKTYKNGGIDEVITTRRLCQIVTTYAVFDNPSKSVEYGVNRFDEDTRKSFIDVYNAIDPREYMKNVDDIDEEEPRAEKVA